MRLSLGLGLFYDCYKSAPDNTNIISNYKADTALIGGGGFILGIVSSPLEANLMYAYTDVGGAYRFNSSSQSWDLITNFPFFNTDPGHQYGISELTLDPNNPDVVYILSGKYATQGIKGDLLKSTDRGNSWIKLGLDVYSGSNNALRFTGPTFQISPNDSNHIVVGTVHEGIWVTFNGGLNPEDWVQSNLISCAPYIQKTSYDIRRAIRAVWIDKLDANVVYAALSDQPYALYDGTNVQPYSSTNAGLYVSTDKGINWVKVSSQPSGLNRIHKITQSSNGTIWITHATGFCKYVPSTGVFTSYTNTTLGISSTGFCAIAVSPFSPTEVTVITYGNFAKQRIFRTTNEGSSWSEITYSYETMPWSTPGSNAKYLTTEVVDCTYNRHVSSNKPDEFYFSNWYAIYKSTNTRATSATFSLLINHIEELVTLGLFCPPAQSGYNIPSLISGNADLGAFVHKNGFDNYPLYVDDYYNNLGQQANRTNYTRTVDFCMQQPRYMTLSGTRNFSPYGNILLVSSDGGTTWSITSSLPPNISASTSNVDSFPQSPRVAYSASTPGVFLVSRTNGEPCLTVNNGSSWITSSSTTKPDSDTYLQFSWKFTLVPDRVNGNKFYYIRDNQLWLATWNGSTSSPSYTWQIINYSTGLRSYHTYQGILSSPTVEGHLWLYTNSTEQGSAKLSKSTDGGTTFTQLSGFDRVIVAALGIGSGISGDASYTVYTFASRNNKWGIYRSVDLGTTWSRLDIGNFKVSNNPNCMGASLQTFGEVFIGSNGSGVYWITPQTEGTVNTILREDGGFLRREDDFNLLRES